MNILLVKTSALGDALHLFPTVAYLRHHFPNARIDWVVEKGLRGLVNAHPQVDRVIGIDTRSWRRGRLHGLKRSLRRLRREKYDVVYDLQGNIKSGLVTRLARAKTRVGFGRRTVAEWPNLLCTSRRYNPPAGQNIRDDYLSVVAQHVKRPIPLAEPIALRVRAAEREIVTHLVGRKGTQIAVCPGSAWPNKQLPESVLVEFLARVSKRFHPHFLWVWGSQQELELAERLRARYPETSVVVPKLTLPALQYLLWTVDLVVAMDSLALHLAGTTPTPTFSLFGPSNPQKYKPFGPHQHLQGGCPYQYTFENRCARLRSCASGACIKSLSGDLCYQTLISWWQAGALPRLRSD